jgi:hypothetical protein
VDSQNVGEVAASWGQNVGEVAASWGQNWGLSKLLRPWDHATSLAGK